jgi:peptidoglycan biosynthesis protein MviN/MurJ (putative lipid II flippase)
VTLIAASLAGLAVGMLSEAGSVVATHAAYARNDARSAFHSMLLRTLVSGVGMVGALLLTHGVAVMVALGLAVSVGNLLGASYLAGILRASLPGTGEGLGMPVFRALVASGLMVVPAYALATYLPSVLSLPAKHLDALVVAAIVGVMAYLGVQRASGSPELASLRGGFGQMLLRAKP